MRLLSFALIGAVALAALALRAATPSFADVAPVFQSPRCMNCHTATDFPRQGDDEHRHIMSVARGTHDHGVASLQCAACHRSVNSADTGVPRRA